MRAALGFVSVRSGPPQRPLSGKPVGPLSVETAPSRSGAIGPRAGTSAFAQQRLIPLPRRYSRSGPPADFAQTVQEHPERFAGVQLRLTAVAVAARIARTRSTGRQVAKVMRRAVIRHRLLANRPMSGQNRSIIRYA